MDKPGLLQLIKAEIQKVAHEKLKELSAAKQVQGTTDFMNSADITEDDFDKTFFHGGKWPEVEEKKRAKIKIQESTTPNLRITTSEIKEFENSFNEILDNIPGATIVFDKKNNGYSICATKRADGIEAKASGILNLGDKGRITWVYSILNGFNINAQNLKLSQSNKTMFEALTNHYDDWQKKWREKLNLPGATAPTEDLTQNLTEPASTSGASIGGAPDFGGVGAGGGAGASAGAQGAAGGNGGMGI